MTTGFSPSPLFMACSLGMLGLCQGAPAQAEEVTCDFPRVHLELATKPEWEAEVPALRARLMSLKNVDTCARVSIRAEAGGVSVKVTSGTRSASRHLTDPHDLVQTVEALVVLPPALEPVAKDRPATNPRADAAPADSPPARTLPPLSSRVEFATAASVRLGGNPLIVGAGIAAFAGLVEGSWLLGVDARWEFADGLVTATAPSGFNMDSGAIGVAVGRRSELGSFSCDALLGPTLVLESQEAYGSALSNEGIGTSAVDARIDLTLRATGPTSSRVRMYAAGDVEVSPHRLSHPKQLDPELPPLPAWSSGVALGVAWGAR